MWTRGPAMLGAAGDPYWSDVLLLLHFNELSSPTSFIDSGPQGLSIARAGSSQKSATSRFGDSSYYFDNSSSYLTVLNSEVQVAPITAPWTYECFVQRAGVGVGTGAFWYLTSAGRFMFDGLGNLLVTIVVGGSSYTRESPEAVGLGDWHHVAVSFDGATIRWFHNGVMYSTESATGTLPPSIMNVGRQSGSDYCFAYVDEVRVTRACRYLSDFPVPTSQFPDGG